MILCFLDTETTGNDVKRCGLVQLSGCIEKDGEVVEKFNWKMKPTREVEYFPEAEKKTGYTKEVVETFRDPHECFNEFWSIIEKYGDRYAKKTDEKIFVVGYNVGFDTDFLIQWFKDNAVNKKEQMYGNGYFNMFFIPGIDVMQLALLTLMEKRIGMENFQLGTVCQKFGLSWNEEESHDSMYDIKKTRALFHILTGKKYLKVKKE